VSSLPRRTAELAADSLKATYGVKAGDILAMFASSPLDLSCATVSETIREVKAWFRQTDLEYRDAHPDDDQ
jgi:hypothetical protein